MAVIGSPHSSLRSLRRTVVRSLHRTGVNRAIGSTQWRRKRLLILAYHGVSIDDEHECNGSLFMSLEQLERRLRLLRSFGCTVLPLSDALNALYDGTLEPRSVAITFDDGYFDFVERAYPLLSAHGIPVTLYLRTHLLGQNVPVFPLICSYVFWKSRRAQVRIPELREEPFDISTRAARDRAARAVHLEARRLGIKPLDRVPLVRSIARHLSVDPEAILAQRMFELMSEEDVRRLSANGVDFQLHTHTHNTPHERQRFVKEIETNRDHIRLLTGSVPRHFCYPSGDYDPLFFPWLDDLGVRSATTCDPGLATAATEPLKLPRFVDTSSTTSEEFQSWLAGTATWLSRHRSFVHPA